MSQQRTLGARIGSGLLTLAAIGGVLCIVFVALAAFFSITLIMFKTGSMGPGIPAGSVAVVREIPASEIHLGDVVTVDRANALPVTHRVTSITAEGNQSVITMKGDANTAEDPEPYTVSRVRLVLFAVPQLGYAISAMSNPFALGGVTLAAAGIVTWAFWPRGNPAPRRPRRSHRGAHAALDRGGRVAAVILLLGGASALVPAPPAQAAVTEEVISGTVLTLLSIGDRTQMAQMPPDQPVLWQVGISADAPDPGEIAISIRSSGVLPLSVAVSVCDTRWIGSACADGGTLVAQGVASSVIGASLPLDTMTSSQQRWVLVEAVLPAAEASNPGDATLRIFASGVGDEVSAGGDLGSLAPTGVTLWTPLALAVGAVVGGILIALVTGRQRQTVAP